MPKPASKKDPSKRRTLVWALLAAYVVLMVGIAWHQFRDRSEPKPGIADKTDNTTAPNGSPPTDLPPFTPPATTNSSTAPDSSPPEPGTAATPNASPSASPSTPSGLPPAPPPTFPERPLNRGPSGLTKELNAADKTIDEDIDLLNEVFVSFRTGLKGGNPVGTNREITRALTGRNKMRLVWVDPAHPAINDKGELCDRWGTPFFFHQESAHAMGVRSAGPDQEMYTEDDTLFEPPQRGPKQRGLNQREPNQRGPTPQTPPR